MLAAPGGTGNCVGVGGGGTALGFEKWNKAHIEAYLIPLNPMLNWEQISQWNFEGLYFNTREIYDTRILFGETPLKGINQIIHIYI